MMELYKNKSHYIYLLFITVLAYLGTFFIVPVLPVKDFLSFYFWIPAVLYINTCLLHWLLLEQGLDRKAVFVLSTLYLLMPLHMDAFKFPSLIQLYIAEAALMISLIFYLKNRINLSVFFLIGAGFLNFKIIGFFPLVFISQKFSSKQKALYGLNTFLIVLYSLPEFISEYSFSLDNLKTVIFSFENLIIPLNFSFLNNSILIDSYYPVWFLIFFILSSLGLIVFGWKSRSSYGKALSFTIWGLLISLFVPVKYYLKSELNHYLYMPSAYPFIAILFFLIFTSLFKKYTSKIIIGSLWLMSILWILNAMSIQASSRDLVLMWDTALGKLPTSYNYMENVQFDYVQILVKNGFTKEAEAIVVEAKKKYLKDRWFVLHISLAAQRQDEELVRRIYDELSELKIPFPEEGLPDSDQ